MELEILYPQINVYHDAFSDPNSFIDEINALNEWQQWYTFGEQTHLGGCQINFDKFPSRTVWDEEMDKCINPSKPYMRKIQNVFYETTSHYVDQYRIELPNWVQTNIGFCRYHADTETDNPYGLTMNYHTDWQQECEQEEGYKFVITSTMYLNDNYDNGEICFRIFDESSSGYTDIAYKPAAGDVLVFNAKPPYYHAVNAVRGAKRYFIRTNWCYYYEGHPEWRAEREKYSEAVWHEMEEKRRSEERKKNSMLAYQNLKE